MKAYQQYKSLEALMKDYPVNQFVEVECIPRGTAIRELLWGFEYIGYLNDGKGLLQFRGAMKESESFAKIPTLSLLGALSEANQPAIFRGTYTSTERVVLDSIVIGNKEIIFVPFNEQP